MEVQRFQAVWHKTSSPGLSAHCSLSIRRNQALLAFSTQMGKCLSTHLNTAPFENCLILLFVNQIQKGRDLVQKTAKGHVPLPAPSTEQPAGFAHCQSVHFIVTPHKPDLSPAFYLQTLSGNYFYWVCKNNVRELIYHRVSAFFSSVLSRRNWRHWKFP